MNVDSFHQYFDNMPVAFTIIELVLNEKQEPVDFIFRYVNQAFAQLEEVKLEDLQDRRFFKEVFPHNNDKKWLKYYYSSAFRDKIYELHEYSPEIGKHLEITCYPWLTPGYCACILSDESELVQVKEQLETLALQDQATTFQNRNAYLNFCNDFESGRNVGVIFVDINQLKTTNDRYGHQSGDALIKMVSERIHAVFQGGGYDYKIFRIGGDEFVIVLLGVSREFCQAQAKALDSSMHNSEEPCFPPVLASIGWGWESRVICLEDLVKAADDDMYQRKKALSLSRPRGGGPAL